MISPDREDAARFQYPLHLVIEGVEIKPVDGNRHRHQIDTVRLEVDFLEPTQVAAEMRLRSRIVEVKPRKVVVETDLESAGRITARGRAVLIRVPDDWEPKAGDGG